METSSLVALIALEKRRILSQGRGLVILYVAAIACPREGADIIEYKGADIGMEFRNFGNQVYI